MSSGWDRPSVHQVMSEAVLAFFRLALLGSSPISAGAIGLRALPRLALSAASDPDQRRGAEADRHDLIQADW